MSSGRQYAVPDLVAMSQQEVADRLGLTVPEVQAAERSAIAKLRASGQLRELWELSESRAQHDYPLDDHCRASARMR